MSRNKTHLPRHWEGLDEHMAAAWAGTRPTLCRVHVPRGRLSDRPTCEGCRKRNKKMGWKAFRRHMYKLTPKPPETECSRLIRRHIEGSTNAFYDALTRQLMTGGPT